MSSQDHEKRAALAQFTEQARLFVVLGRALKDKPDAGKFRDLMLVWSYTRDAVVLAGKPVKEIRERIPDFQPNIRKPMPPQVALRLMRDDGLPVSIPL
jgi:hypothetical protein